MTEPHKLTLAHEFSYVMLTDEELEVQLYGRIGNSFFEEGITAQMIGAALAKSPRAKKLKVKLSSPGGNVGDGMAIRSMLATHPAHVTLDIEGMAASAGSVIAMAGDVIRMHDGASMMLHEGQTAARGNIADFKRQIAALETINDGAATVYAARSGKTKEEIRQLMAAETWFTPQQAKDMGLVDEVVPAKKQAPATMYFDLSPYGYQNVPPDVAARIAGAAAVGGSPRKRTEDTTMTYARIAMALGLTEGADENAILQRVDTNKTSAARDKAAVAELCQLTGKENATEALGVARAYQQSAARVTELEKQLGEASGKLEMQEREAIFMADERDPKGRKFTPAMKEFWKEEPVAKLKAFAEKAPYVLTTSLPKNPPQGHGQAPDGSPHAGPGGAPKPPAAEGGTKTYAQMSYIERHTLKRSNPDLFRQLKQEAAEAGEV